MDQTLSNAFITQLLQKVIAVFELTNENRFKIAAYQKALDAIERLPRELKNIWAEGKLRQTEGIGPSMAEHLDELFTDGNSPYFNKIIAQVPESIFPLIKIPSIGPKRAYKLVTYLKLYNEKTVVDDLVREAEQGHIRDLESFGEKSERDILEAVSLYKSRADDGDRIPLPIAYEAAAHVMEYLSAHPHVERIDSMGSLRRMVSTIGDVDVAVVADDQYAKEIIAYFTQYPGCIHIDNAGEKKASIIVTPHIRVDLRIQKKENYGSMMQYFTGSKAHNIKLRDLALRKGFSLSEYGIKRMDTSELEEYDNETSFYRRLGLQYVPPEIREGNSEIELAQKNKLPQLVELKDMNGDLHTHSSFPLNPSHDLGQNSFEEMVEKAKQLGYSYFGFSEHNPAMTSTSREDIIEYLKNKKSAIEKVQYKYPDIELYSGLEVDISSNGELAIPKEAISYLDYIIASVHSSFAMPVDKMTERVLRGLSYNKVKVLGHPTGRLLGKRQGFELNWNQIFNYVYENNIALEINASLYRLDLPDMLVHEAKKRKVRFAIGSDAHATDQMDTLIFGVSVARRGWLEKPDIMNAKDKNSFRTWIKE
ncbi:DNA polymerase/3'-5' exonuclease PolX [Candidatus Roizmanbacteria bacterium]|nr:DNA polymerase/3'-5' exonuclease PolX [Candidatus Roizmanbacteria bacterium]